MESLAAKNFIYAVFKNNILSKEECDVFTSKIGSFTSLEELAQHVLDIKTEGLDIEEAESILTSIQNILEQLPLIDDSSSGDSFITNKPYSFDTKDSSNLRIILRNAAESGASDLHISAGSPIFIRESGIIKKLNDDVISEELSKTINLQCLDDAQLEEFNNNKAITYPLAFEHDERYRASLILHKDGIAGTYHILPQRVKELSELGFTESNIKVINSLLDHHNGLILIAGPMGCGKTTTLASLIKILNKDNIAPARAHEFEIVSPTYGLIHEVGCIAHADFYRIKEREELIHLEMGLYLENKDYFIIEWGMPFLSTIIKEVDERGRINLSIKQADPDFAQKKGVQPSTGPGPGGPGRGRPYNGGGGGRPHGPGGARPSYGPRPQGPYSGPRPMGNSPHPTGPKPEGAPGPAPKADKPGFMERIQNRFRE